MRLIKLYIFTGLLGCATAGANNPEPIPGTFCTMMGIEYDAVQRILREDPPVQRYQGIMSVFSQRSCGGIDPHELGTIQRDLTLARRFGADECDAACSGLANHGVSRTFAECR